MAAGAFYLSITPLQEPFDNGTDPQGRVEIIFNALLYRRYHTTTTVEDEIVKRLVDMGVGVFGTSIFAGSLVAIPDGAGPYVTLVVGSGAGPEFDHDSGDAPARVRPTLQVSVHASNYLTAMAKARAAYDALVRVRNMQLNT